VQARRARLGDPRDQLPRNILDPSDQAKPVPASGRLWLEQNQGLGLWPTGLAAVGLLVGVILAGFAVRDGKRTRHGQVLIDLYRQMAAPEMVASFTEYVAYTPDELAALASKFFDPTGHRQAMRRRLKPIASLLML
jgi:hypothetical protein